MLFEELGSDEARMRIVPAVICHAAEDNGTIIDFEFSTGLMGRISKLHPSVFPR